MFHLVPENVDVENTANHLPNKKISIGFVAATSLTAADVGIAEESEFRQQSFLCYKSIVAKLKERSPIKHDFVLHLRSFSPQYIVNHPNSSVTHFEKSLTYLINTNFFKPTECDEMIKQYKNFIALVRLEFEEKFAGFDIKS